MAGVIVLPCPSCHAGTQEPHCISPTCSWRICGRCELVLSLNPAGDVRSVSTKVTPQ